MPMDISGFSIVLVGSIAAVCTTAAFIPQVLRVWRLKRADEISFATFLVFSVGTFAWFVYGVWIGSYPVIVANGLTFALSLAMVGLKLKYGRTLRDTTAKTFLESP